MQASITDKFLRIQSGLSLRDRDPLSFWHHASPQSAEATKLLMDFDELYARAANKAGKPLADDEPVLTPSGWVPISELKIGDQVVSRDGSYCNVMGVFPQGEKPILRLTFSDGTYSRCSPDHLWVVLDQQARFGNGPERIMCANELSGGLPAPKRFAIPSVAAVQSPVLDLPLHPYLLGALLGDGYLGPCPKITKNDLVFSDKIVSCLPEGCRLTRWVGKRGAVELLLVGKPNHVRYALIALGLQGCRSWEKFIPEVYMRGSIEQRIDLLYGLMDTDGTADKRGKCSFSSASERLARQVVELVQLMGGEARVSHRSAFYRYKGERRRGRTSWIVTLRSPFNPFSIPRKAERWLPSKRAFYKILRKVGVDGTATATCIAVDHPSGTFVTRGGIVTHNTEWAAAVTLAMLQKRKELDGIALPQWRGPVTGLAMSLDYNQQKLSVQQTILRLLGQWPHHAKWKADDVLSSLRIMPVRGGDDESSWSLLTFMSQENKRAGLGARADIVWADEPPVEPIWREVRKAAHAGRRMIRLISATPIFRRQWAWLRAEYGDPGRGAITRHEDLVEVRWSLEDNSALTRSEIDALLRLFAREPALYDARVFGDYIDASGACPFNLDTLEAMMGEARDPDIVEWKITREQRSDEGLVLVAETVPVEVFKLPKVGKSYYMPVDPSAGIKDSKHDPGGLHDREVGSGDLCVRFNGYIGSYGMGTLAAGLARQYNDAAVDPETTGGWGEGVLRGLSDAQYNNICKQKRELVPGEWHTELGFKTSWESRSAMIASIQAWLEAWRCGVKYAECPSRDILQCLIDTILDEEGKAVAAPGFHDEDLILWGQGLRKAVTTQGRFIPEYHRPVMTRAEKLARLISGEDREEDPEQAPWTGRLLVPIGRR